MQKTIKRNQGIALLVLLVIASIAVDVWFQLRRSVHPEFGQIYTTRMAESYDQTQTRWDMFIAPVKRFLKMPDHQPQSPNGYDFGLRVGPTILGWSARNKAPPRLDGFIYLVSVEPKGGDAPLWEVALSEHARLIDVKRAHLQCEFYGKNDPRGSNVFGAAWDGRTLVMPEGQVFFTRLATNHSMLYVVRLARQGAINGWGTMQIEYVTVTNAPPAVAPAAPETSLP